MRHQHRLTIATVVLLSTCTASAETVYKSIDAQGRVTYSSTPPVTVPEGMIEKVKIEPGPTEQQQLDAVQRSKALEVDRRRAAEAKQEQQTQPSSVTSDDRRPAPNSSSLNRVDTSERRAPRGATRNRTTRTGRER